MSLAARALASKSGPKKQKTEDRSTPLKAALKEAWDASKGDDFEKFSAAMDAALAIKIQSGDE